MYTIPPSNDMSTFHSINSAGARKCFAVLVLGETKERKRALDLS